MHKFLDADWYRFVRTYRLFWTLLALLAILPALLFAGFGDMEYVADAYQGTSMIVALVALPICILFYSTQFSEGTIRNRLVCGGSRAGIYFSGLLMSTGMCFALLGAAAFSVLLAITLSPGSAAEDTEWFWTFSCTWLVDVAIGLVALVCLVHMIVTITHSRLSTFICAAIVLIAMLAVSAMLVSALSEAPMVYNYTELPDGTIVHAAVAPNPNYVSGTARDVACFFQDALPTSALISRSLTSMESTDSALKAQMVRWLYWIVECVIFSAVGCTAMKRRDFN